MALTGRTMIAAALVLAAAVGCDKAEQAAEGAEKAAEAAAAGAEKVAEQAAEGAEKAAAAAKAGAEEAAKTAKAAGEAAAAGADKAAEAAEAGAGKAAEAAGSAAGAAVATVAGEAGGAASPALLDPSKATEEAPATYKVKLETTKGDVILEVKREWAPRGADRFYNLVKIGYYDDTAFFRVIKGFMAQIGIHGDGKVNAAWREARIQDDEVSQSNTRGMVSFATAGPNTRTTQFFVNYGDNVRLDQMGFSPFARVVEGMGVIDSLYGEYGEGAPRGRGPRQDRLQTEGNTYLKAEFPNLDYIKKATVLP